MGVLAHMPPLALLMVMHGVAANFAPHFAPSPAFVAQWIEQRFPKPQVAGPIPAEGAKYCVCVIKCELRGKRD